MAYDTVNGEETIFELQMVPERVENLSGDPCWVNLTEGEAKEVYERLHAYFSGADKRRSVVLIE